MPKSAPYLSPRNHFDMRARALRAAYQRTLGCKPTVLESAALDMASALTARALAAASDPACSHEEAARVAGAAQRARESLAEIIKAARRRKAPVSTTKAVPPLSTDLADILGQQ
jgi:hypothetical protein